MNADNQWHFTANAVNSNQSVTFTVKAADGDGDFDTNSQTVTIVNVNNPLVQTANFTGIVEEEHLNSAQAVGIDDVTSTRTATTTPRRPMVTMTWLAISMSPLPSPPATCRAW